MRITRHRINRLFFFILLALAAILVALLVWLSSPVGAPLPKALAALESDQAVRVTQERWITFEPQSQAAQTGFIFYPGGRVAAESYAPLGRALAEEGYLAVLVSMPLNLAILNPAAAADVIAAYPIVQHWVIGGHSLGGVMAARFAHDNPDLVDGLVLLAAYPEEQINLSGRDLAVATIYAELDGLASVQEIESAFPRLPADALRRIIYGGNHAGFGFYGEQPGDNPAQISRDQQFAHIVREILGILAQAGK